MAESNGKSRWIHWLVASLFLVIFTIISFTGKGVVANDRRNTDAHVRIEDKIDVKVDTLTARIDKKLEKMIDIQIAQGLALARIEEKIK